MKRIYIAGLTWQLANQPCLLLSNDSSEFIVPFPCDPAEVSLLFRIARREITPANLPLMISSLAKVLAQTCLSITSIELLERKESSDRAVLNVLATNGLNQRIELNCMEAVAMALIFDRPVFAAEEMLQPIEKVVPEIGKEKQEQEANSFKAFLENIKANDFSRYAESKQWGV